MAGAFRPANEATLGKGLFSYTQSLSKVNPEPLRLGSNRSDEAEANIFIPEPCAVS